MAEIATQHNWLAEHFRHYRQLAPWSFCWRITLESLLVQLVVILLLQPLDLPATEFNVEFGVVMILASVVAPVIETFLLQALPVFVASFFVKGFWWLVAILTLAFCFVHWQEKSWVTALWVTALSHFIHNTVISVVVLLVWLTIL